MNRKVYALLTTYLIALSMQLLDIDLLDASHSKTLKRMLLGILLFSSAASRGMRPPDTRMFLAAGQVILMRWSAGLFSVVLFFLCGIAGIQVIQELALAFAIAFVLPPAASSIGWAHIHGFHPSLCFAVQISCVLALPVTLPMIGSLGTTLLSSATIVSIGYALLICVPVAVGFAVGNSISLSRETSRWIVFAAIVLLNLMNAIDAFRGLRQNSLISVAICMLLSISICWGLWAVGYRLWLNSRLGRSHQHAAVFGFSMLNTGVVLTLASSELGLSPEVSVGFIAFTLMQHVMASRGGLRRDSPSPTAP